MEIGAERIRSFCIAVFNMLEKLEMQAKVDRSTLQGLQLLNSDLIDEAILEIRKGIQLGIEGVIQERYKAWRGEVSNAPDPFEAFERLTSTGERTN